MQRYDFFPNYQNFSRKNFSFYEKYSQALICINFKTFYTLLYIMRERRFFGRYDRKSKPFEHNKKDKDENKKEQRGRVGRKGRRAGKTGRRTKKTYKSLVICSFLYNFAAEFE